MKNAWSLLFLLLTSTVLILMAVSPSRAIDENRVAVVVDFGNGQIATKCVSFAEVSITGFEALQRSGLPVETDFQTGGAAVCRIDGKGCPSDDCFCECRGGGECKYWSYWHFENGSWNYSVAGSSIYQVRDGAVDGWVWGLGSITQASPPPAIPFQEVCTAGVAPSATATSTSAPTSTPLILPTFAPTESAPDPSPTAPQATSTRSGDVDPSATLPASENNVSTPAAVSSFPTETPAAEVLMGESDDITPLPVTAALQAFEAYPSQSGGGTPNLPLLAPIEPGLDMSPTAEMEAVGIGATEATGDSGAVIALPPGAPPFASSTPTATPVVVSAVVGVGATIDQPMAVPVPVNSEQAHNWNPYAGFLGLLLILCALALLVYRRREAISSIGER